MRKLYSVFFAALAAFVSLVGPARADDAPAAVPSDKVVKFDWTLWRRLPVWDDGRVKPLDTLARELVPTICNRESPTLSLKGAVTEAQLVSPEFAGARSLFPGDKERKFTPAEIVFSWLVETEKWQRVPFLVAEHDDVRNLLGVPLFNEAGQRIRYVSPEEVEASDAFHQRMELLEAQMREARMAEKKFEPQGLDRKLTNLRNAFNLFRQLSFDDYLASEAKMALRGPLDAVVQDWEEVSGLVDTIPASDSEPGASIGRLKKAYAALEATLSRQGRIERRQATDVVEELVLSADKARSEFEKLRERLTAQGAEQGLDEEKAKALRANLSKFAFGFQRLAQSSMGLMAAIDSTAESIRVVPALVPEALAKRRRDGAPTQPWLDLQVILFGSPNVLRAQGYPYDEMLTARSSFANVVKAYQAGDPDAFQAGMERFDMSLADLADKIEPKRLEFLDDKKLAQNLDRAVLALTQRPAPGSTAADRIRAEIHYHAVDPFMWVWAISLTSFVLYALAFGVLRKPMFWAGTAVLGLSLLVSVYGFYLRVFVSSWAPVTNMYETVVYVPFVVGCLGLWFLLLPVTWDGLRRGWQLTAIPFSWEAGPAKSESSPSVWPWGAGEFPFISFLLLLPRIAMSTALFYVLALAPYAAGDRTIINLKPRLDVGSDMPNGTSISVWLVGIAMLVPCVWFLPRVLLALVSTPITVPWTVMTEKQDRMSAVYDRKTFGMGSAFVAFFLCLVAWFASSPGESAPILNAKFTPLNPVLRDNFWLTIHVLTIVSSYGAGFLAWILGVCSLFHYIGGKYRSPVPVAEPADDRLRPALSAVDGPEEPRGRRPPEQCTTLAGYTYKAMQVAVLLLITGTILGGLWADVSWGRFWGWDAKEVWALISGLCYLAILHGRYAGWFGNFGTAIGGVIGFSSIMFSWYGVNFILPLFSSTGEVGLHSYGSGAGGQREVLLFVAASWAIAGLAAMRYLAETSSPDTNGWRHAVRKLFHFRSDAPA